MPPSLKTGPEPCRDGPVVILVTGSRRWSSHEIVREALRDAITACVPERATPHTHPTRDMLLRHGAAKGLDTIAAYEARALGMKIEAFPAKWTAPCDESCEPYHRVVRKDRTTWCPAAGPRRNQEMIDAGFSVCLAFPIGGAQGSRGTFDCATRAQRAGGAVWWYDLEEDGNGAATA